MHVINLICILLDALHGNGWRAELVKVCILSLPKILAGRRVFDCSRPVSFLFAEL